MTKDEFLKAFADNLDIDAKLNEQTLLHDLDEWDSMAFLATMGLFDELFGIKIEGEELKKCANLGDIIALAKDKIK